jgi:CBS domain-containing protein
MTIGRCLEEFAKRKILSAPLVIEPTLEDDALDEAGGGVSLAEEGGAAVPEAAPTLLGWIDTGDILRSFLQHLEDHLAEEARAAATEGEGGGGVAAGGGSGGGAEKKEKVEKKKKELPTRMLELMTLLEKLGPSFAARKLITVSGGKDRALVFSATASSSLLEAMRDLFLPSGRNENPSSSSSSRSPSSPSVVHRVAVFDGHGAITHVISQLDVLRFLLRNRERWSSVSGRSIAELGLLSGKAPVLTVDPHTPALLALREMRDAGVSGAAVVSAGGGPAGGEGTAIANLSVSDLRAVDPRHLSVLALPVAELLALLHKTTYVG